ncbi:MAG: QueT transporter family protein [Dehalococcoidia bacterium]
MTLLTTIQMWRSRRMVAYAGLSAALYALLLVAFKQSIVLIPGVTELRLASLLPPALSLLLGPAAAWGCAAGNLIGDVLGGTLTAGSIGGVLGNFLLGFLPFALWGRLGLASSNEDPALRSLSTWLEYLIVVFLASAAAGVTIGWGVDAAGLVPFAVLASIIIFNNTVAGTLGGLIVALLYRPLAARGWTWDRVIKRPEPRRGFIGPVLIALGGGGGWILGTTWVIPPLVLPVTGVCVLLLLVGVALL